jgi:serine/threonine protein kinase
MVWLWGCGRWVTPPSHTPPTPSHTCTQVYKGGWRGTDVAIKRFLDQGLSSGSVREFKSEVALMARLRHPNILLFLGAVVQVRQCFSFRPKFGQRPYSAVLLTLNTARLIQWIFSLSPPDRARQELSNDIFLTVNGQREVNGQRVLRNFRLEN